MALNKDIWMGIAIGAGVSFLGIYLINIAQKEQELNIANKAIDSGMFNNLLPTSNSSANSSGGGL